MQHYAGQYYHVYNRGVNRQPIFANEENHHFLLRRVKQFLPLYQIRIVAYSLMPNHYHLLFGVDKEGSLSPFLQRLFNSYSQAFNRQQNRTGTLFEGRAKSILVNESNCVYALVRYIHLNPVVAGLVANPEDWCFSNFLEWIDGRNDELFDPHFRELFFSSSHEYKNFVLCDIPDALERKLAKYYLD
ncbi:MAG TPA: transposase [Anaerolineales bacterium]|nr:transposase [Anaerolineales bacterium]